MAASPGTRGSRAHHILLVLKGPGTKGVGRQTPMGVSMSGDEEVRMNMSVWERAQVQLRVGVYFDAQEGVRMTAGRCVVPVVGVDR